MLSINLASYYIPTPLAVSTPSELLQLGLEMKKWLATPLKTILNCTESPNVGRKEARTSKNKTSKQPKTKKGKK